MIVFKPRKYNFIPKPVTAANGYTQDEPSFIEIKTIFGERIYLIKKEGRKLILNGYTFEGQFDSLKISRNHDKLINSFNVQLFCKECGDLVYKLTGKLPLLFIIKTDFHVTTDRG